jgi:hypothetical protein
MAGFEPDFRLVTSHFHAVPWVGAVGADKVKSEQRIHAFNSIFLFLWSLELISELLLVHFLFVKPPGITPCTLSHRITIFSAELIYIMRCLFTQATNSVSARNTQMDP